MKRFGLILGALLIAACSEDLPSIFAGLEGAYVVEHAESVLLVASSANDELRVLDLTGAAPEFVRAPNPIEALAIPVVDQPVEIATASIFSTRISAGRFAFVRGVSSREISVIDTQLGALRELFRIRAPEGTTVTAITALGDPASVETTLFYATWDGQAGRVYRKVLLPGTVEGEVTLVDPAPDEHPLLLDDVGGEFTYAGETVNRLLVLPRPATGDAPLVIARRRMETVGGVQRAVGGVELRRADGSRLPLAFPYQVKDLETIPTVSVGETSIPAGARVYGVLDEEACGAALECSGVIGVDTIDAVVVGDSQTYTLNAGQISLDEFGLPMLTVHPAVNGALVTDLEISANVISRAPSLDAQNNIKIDSRNYPLLGAFATADRQGQLMFFDALLNRHVNFLLNTLPIQVGPVYVAPNGAVRSFDAGAAPLEVIADRGIARDEVISVRFEGEIPGLMRLPRTTDASATFDFPVPLASRVQVGDRVMLSVGEASCELTVASVDGAAGTLTTSSAVPAECTGATTFTVRASGAQPFVAEGLRSESDFDTVRPSGYIGRLAVGESLEEQVEPYLRVSPSMSRPRITLLGPLEPDLVRDGAYRVQIASSFRPFYTSLVSNAYRTITSIAFVDQLPGSIGNYFFAHPWVPGQNFQFQFGVVTQVSPIELAPTSTASPILLTHQ